MPNKPMEYTELFGPIAWLETQKAESVCNFSLRQSLVFLLFDQIHRLPESWDSNFELIATANTHTFDTGCAVFCLGVAAVAYAALKNPSFQKFIKERAKETIVHNLTNNSDGLQERYQLFFNENPNAELHQLYREAKTLANPRS